MSAQQTSAPRRTSRFRPGRIPNYLLLIVVAIVAVGPLYWLLASSFKSPDRILQLPTTLEDWIPFVPHWQNYVDAWNSAPFDRLYVNSIVVTTLGTILQSIVAVLSAYAFCFLRFPAKNLLFFFLLGAMMVPGHVVLLPNYLTVAQLGWVNTYAGLIVPGLGSVFATFLLRQHMLTLPGEVSDAAKVDGASHLQHLWHVVLPMSRPMIATVVIVTMVEKWNDFIWPLIVTSSDTMRTLPIGLLLLKSAEGYTNWGAVMASTVFVVVPVLIVFVFAQRHIIAGLTQGATKG